MAAAGVAYCDGEVAEVVCEERLPLDCGAHLDGAGCEDGEFAIGGLGGRVAYFEVWVRVRVDVVLWGWELLVGVWDVAVDVGGAFLGGWGELRVARWTVRGPLAEFAGWFGGYVFRGCGGYWGGGRLELVL